MGVGIYLKPVNKDGRSLLYLRAKKGSQIFRKSLSIKVKPSDWNARNYQVKVTAIDSIIVNRKLIEITNNMNIAWSLFESGSYTWEEFCTKLGGGNATSNENLKGFLDTVLKAKYDNENSYKTYVGVVQAVFKEAGTDDIPLGKLTNEFIGSCVQGWKKRLSPTSVRTYLTHLGKIKNLAYQKGLISEPFIRRDEWKVKKGSSIKIIETVKTEDFKEAIEKIRDVYDLQAMYFYLLMFCLRGFYQGDIVTMHLYDTNLCEPDEPDGTIYLDSTKKRYIKHQRSRTGELMEIRMDLEPILSLLYELRDTVRLTHGQRVNKKTGERFKKANSVYSENEQEGWIFSYDINDSKTHKNVWDVYQKRIKKLLGKPFKTARKTFESYALKLKVSQDIRFKLLGHANPTIKAHYQDWEWEELKEQVDEAHLEVLKEYKAEELFEALKTKSFKLDWTNYI
ncbi:Arm DNA-binding domain-containing protein [Flavobacteriaceae bacterium]|nr:Arm DNA-binding domain-containing protein [Flavobacteriaceae bacterium]MDC1401912.1 Arm DNA-binding domain-containing protein [Flavobacteriaceae bacterium]